MVKCGYFEFKEYTNPYRCVYGCRYFGFGAGIEKIKKGHTFLTKYTMWNPRHVYYSKAHSLHTDKGFNPRKCFKVKCNGKNVEIGEQLDFVTCKIIHDLIALYSEEEVV